MYELTQAGENSFAIEAPAKIGIWRTQEGVYLIDSGNDKEAGRRIRKILDAQGWKLLGIINTHSNADHIGGNQYLQRQTGCPVFANGMEAAFTQYPLLEPAFLFGGCPPKEMRHKFLMAQGSEVSPLSDPRFPKELEIIPLPGHFFDMIGIRTPDDVVYLADCICSKETLEKYHLGFLYDVGASLNTLDMLENLEGALFLPAHAPALDKAGLLELVQINRDKINEIAQRVLSLCDSPVGFEDILQGIFRSYGLQMNFEQYFLIGSTLRAYLTWHKEAGRLEAEFLDNRMLWKRV